jgi:hypothetical protein
MVLNTHRVSKIMLEDSSRQSLCLNVLAPLLRVFGLHDYHVSSITTPLEQSSSGRSFLKGRDHLDKVAADWYCKCQSLSPGKECVRTQEVLQTPLPNSRIFKDDFCSQDVCLISPSVLDICASGLSPYNQLLRAFNVLRDKGNLA